MMHEAACDTSPSMGLEWHILCVQQDLNTTTLQPELYNYYITKENSPSSQCKHQDLRSLALVMQMSA